MSDPTVRRLTVIRREIRERGMEEIGWLREHAQDQVDNARIVGAEDAYNAALLIVDKHIKRATTQAKRRQRAGRGPDV